MIGQTEVITALQSVLTAELTAINQYILHSEMHSNWGYTPLGEQMKKFAIQEMKHAEKIIERILFLGGAPMMDQPIKINVGKNVVEMFQNDLALEYEAVARLNKTIELSCTIDSGSRLVFEDILEEEEEHANYIEGELQQIDDMGVQNYLATKNS